MAGKTRSTKSSWMLVSELGEKVMAAGDLHGQCEVIKSSLQEFLGGECSVWINDRLLRLPGRNQNNSIEDGTHHVLMDKAITSGGLIKDTVQNRMALPIINQNTILGAVECSRTGQTPFTRKEEDALREIVQYIALALTNVHRVAVEQWRLEQLQLVRKVSEQLVNLHDLDELSHRLTHLIQKTFHYYYVALFTVEPEKQNLMFRSSAGPVGRSKKKRSSLALEVEMGQGLIGLAASQGEELISNDIHHEPRFKYIDKLPDTLSEVVLPLKIENRVLGVLDVQSNQLDTFHPNDLLVLRALAANISIAVESAYLFSALHNRAQHLALVTEISRDITTILDLEGLLKKVTELIRERLGYPHVHLFSVHHNRRKIYHEAGSGWRTPAMDGYSLDMDSSVGLIPWVATHGQSVIVNDISTDPRYTPSPLPPGDTKSEMVIPLIFDGQVVGVMDLQADKKDAFLEEDRVICESLADTISAAMHNADVYESEKWRRQVAESLREVAGLLTANVSLDDVLDTVLKELEKDLPCEVSALWLLDDEELYLAHIRGSDPIDVEIARTDWPDSSTFLMDALNSEQPVIRKPTDPIDPVGSANGFSADYSSIAARLKAGNQPLGILTLAHSTTGRYGHEARTITSTFAGYAAVAIENARLYDTAQEQAYASAALLQVAQTVTNANNIDDLLESISRITPILVGVESCAIFLYQDGKYFSSHAYGMSEEILTRLTDRHFSEGDYPLLDAVRAGSEPVIAKLTTEHPEEWFCPELALTKEEAFFAREMGERLLIGFPLLIKNEFFGVMLIEETSDARRFRQKRIEIISGIAQQLTMSLQNERLQVETSARERLEYEFNLARQIQETFLPGQLPEFEKWDLAAYWKPARQVAGDFYDVFQLKDDKLGLIIADVSDKGIPAALFMAVVRTLVRAIILDTESPADVLTRVNEIIIPENQQGMFVTVFYGVLSMESGEMVYANAGHNPPFLITKEKVRIHELKKTGMALGIQEKVIISEEKRHLRHGDLLLAYTDGVTEAVSQANDFFGEDKLKALLKENHTHSAGNIIDKISSAVYDFMGTDIPMDDLTLLALKRRL